MIHMVREIVRDPSRLTQRAEPAGVEDLETARDLLDTLAAAESKEEPPPAEDLSATRRLNIHDLKFGPNYRSEEN